MLLFAFGSRFPGIRHFCFAACVRFESQSFILLDRHIVLLHKTDEQSNHFGLQGTWGRLGVAGALFVSLYALPVLALDSTLRGMVMALVKRLR